MRLVARTRRLDGDIDLAAFGAGPDGVVFEQGGIGLAGRGEVARVPARDAAAILARFEVDDEVGVPGTGPVAFAALPFLDSLDGDVVVPATVVGRDENGVGWITTIGGPEREPVPEPVARAGPGSFTVTATRAPDDWCDAVATAVEAMRAGRLDKVVLAREVVVEADAPIDVPAVLRRLRATYPTALLFKVGGFLGATPELLVSRMGDVVRSHPHAGTTPRSGDPAADARAAGALLASVKNRAEHRIAIDMVLDALLPFCSYVDSEPEPSVVTLANVQHLATLVEGRLSSPAAHVLELVAAVHPNPMVCGWPTDAALALLAELEGFDRGRYAGAVGWTDRHGSGRFAVSIRCAEIDGTQARLYAGNGIVADSDPATELAETRAKLQAMLGALVRP